jgi:AraC-like DNA-binding protein
MDQQLINNIKQSGTFEKRVQILTTHYEDIIEQYRGSLQPINIVTDILQKAVINNSFNTTIEDLAAHFSISTRTLQRYFETGTGVSSKQALQVLRIRKAVSHIISRPQTFHYGVYGYYDYSHFHKHLRQFLQKDSLVHLQPHLQLLQIARKKELR